MGLVKISEWAERICYNMNEQLGSPEFKRDFSEFLCQFKETFGLKSSETFLDARNLPQQKILIRLYRAIWYHPAIGRNLSEDRKLQIIPLAIVFGRVTSALERDLSILSEEEPSDDSVRRASRFCWELSRSIKQATHSKKDVSEAVATDKLAG